MLIVLCDPHLQPNNGSQPHNQLAADDPDADADVHDPHPGVLMDHVKKRIRLSCGKTTKLNFESL